MKNMNFLILLVSVLFFASCKKSDDENVEPQTTDLQITVVNELGERINGANVTIYRLKTDYSNNINAIGTEVTDSKGQVVFKDLNSINYYFNIEKNPATNLNTEQKTLAPLSRDLLNTITVLIE